MNVNVVAKDEGGEDGGRVRRSVVRTGVRSVELSPFVDCGTGGDEARRDALLVR